MGSSELQVQTESGLVAMPNNICCVVVEYLPGGALKNYLIKNMKKKLPFKVFIQLALDLARGGMAVEDPSSPSGVKLVIKDYPHPNAVKSDFEIQEWWKEIKPLRTLFPVLFMVVDVRCFQFSDLATLRSFMSCFRPVQYEILL